MSATVRRKNPYWYWAAETDTGAISIGQFNPYVGPAVGTVGNAAVGYFNAANTRPEAIAWRDNWFGGEFVDFSGGCCWTEDDFYFVHNSQTANGGLWRTDRWLSTRPVKLWSREEMGMSGRNSFALIAFEAFDCLVMWLGEASGGANAGPRAVRIKLSGPPNVGGQQYVQHGPGSILRGWASDRINGRLFISYQQSNGDHNVEGLSLTANNGLTNPLSSLYVVDPGATSIEEPVPRLLYQPTFDYLLGRVLIPETELDRQTREPLVHRIVDLSIPSNNGPALARTAYEYPAPFFTFDVGDGPQRFYFERPHAVFSNALDRKVYQIRHRLVENINTEVDNQETRDRVIAETGLWQYDYAAIPAASQGATRDLVNPERLCDDPLEANFGTTVFNDVQRTVWGMGCRSPWEL